MHILGGIELQRFGLEEDFIDLLDTVNAKYSRAGNEIHFVTSALSKSVISEDHPHFEGCVTLSQNEVERLVGDDGCIVGLGAWTIGKDTGNQNIRNENVVLASHQNALVGAKLYPMVLLKTFMQELKAALVEDALPQHSIDGLRLSHIPSIANKSLAATEPYLGYDGFFHTLESWLTKDDIMIVDAGFPLIGAQSVKISAQGGFVAQAAWLAIGYSVAAGTGVKCAKLDKRAIVVVGDGAFHETCQAVADHHAYEQNTVVFVLANGIYGIEQEIVNPNPFRDPPVDYKDPLLNSVYPYNALPQWKISKLAEGFGGIGRKVDNLGELEQVMKEIRDNTKDNFLVEVTIPKTDVPNAIRAELAISVGEDETENPNWPPASKF